MTMKTRHILLILNFIIFELTEFVHSVNVLGKHSLPAGGATLGGRFPHPSILYNHFIEPGNPLLMKDILEQTDHPAFLYWDDHYMEYNFGDEEVRIWMGNPPDRRGMILSDFIKDYKHTALCVSDDLPESMKDDFLVPPALQCGGIQDNLHRPGLYFSIGGDKTLLHYNNVDYISCLLDGHQEFVLYDMEQKELVEADGWVEDGGYSLVDVEAVDEKKFPSLFSAPWRQVSVSKGDCVFIPYGWYQQVSSRPGRTLAVTLKFSHLWWFNKRDCDDTDRDSPSKPLSHFSILKDFGELRTPLLAPFANKSSISKELFEKTINCGSSDLTEQFWQYLDQNNDGSLSWQELYNFDMNYKINKFYECYMKHQREETEWKEAVIMMTRDNFEDSSKTENVKVSTTKKKKMDKHKVEAENKKMVSEGTEQVKVSVETSRDSERIIRDKDIKKTVAINKATGEKVVLEENEIGGKQSSQAKTKGKPHEEL